MMPQYQIVQMTSGVWNIFDNWKSEWVKADFQSEGAALAFIAAAHPDAEISTR